MKPDREGRSISSIYTVSVSTDLFDLKLLSFSGRILRLFPSNYRFKSLSDPGEERN